MNTINHVAKISIAAASSILVCYSAFAKTAERHDFKNGCIMWCIDGNWEAGARKGSVSCSSGKVEKNDKCPEKVLDFLEGNATLKKEFGTPEMDSSTATEAVPADKALPAEKPPVVQKGIGEKGLK